MPKKFLTAIDLNKNELQNAVIQKLSSAPSSPVESQIYWNTTTKAYFIYSGTVWIQLADQTSIDSALQGLNWKDNVVCATTANITLSGNQAIDGYTTQTGDRVLVKNQSTGSQNGIYIASTGAWTRATDFDSGAKIASAVITVDQGTTNADTTWRCSNDSTAVIGTTSITISSFGTTTPSASTSTAGIVQLATLAEAEAKSEANKALTPSSVANFPVKKTFTIGDGTNTTYALTHSLNNKDVVTQVRQVSNDEVVECDIVNTSTTVTTLTLAVAPTTNSIRAVIIG